jgi:hypothetical protein
MPDLNRRSFIVATAATAASSTAPLASPPAGGGLCGSGRGMLHIDGDFTVADLEAFRREWREAVWDGTVIGWTPA